jgi:hypothetical protein
MTIPVASIGQMPTMLAYVMKNTELKMAAIRRGRMVRIAYVAMVASVPA